MTSNFPQKRSSGFNRPVVLGEVNVGKNRDVIVETKRTAEGEQVISLVQRVTIQTDIPMDNQYRTILTCSLEGMARLLYLLNSDEIFNVLPAIDGNTGEVIHES